MERVVSATEARVHFGELLRRVASEGECVVVERAGQPRVVVLSMREYRRLKGAREGDRQATLERALEVGRRIRHRRGDRALTPPEEVIREMRAERSGKLADLH